MIKKPIIQWFIRKILKEINIKKIQKRLQSCIIEEKRSKKRREKY